MNKREFIMPGLPNEIFKIVKESLKNQLKHAMENNELIDVSHVRGLGKTEALIEFAKENGYLAIVNEVVFSDNKESCVTKRHLKELDCDNDLIFVIDEGINLNTDGFRGKNIKIVTGYYTDFNKKHNNIDILDETMEVIEKDLGVLCRKRTKAISSNDTKTAFDCTRLIRDSIQLLMYQRK